MDRPRLWRNASLPRVQMCCSLITSPDSISTGHPLESTFLPGGVVNSSCATYPPGAGLIDTLPAQASVLVPSFGSYFGAQMRGGDGSRRKMAGVIPEVDATAVYKPSP